MDSPRSPRLPALVLISLGLHLAGLWLVRHSEAAPVQRNKPLVWVDTELPPEPVKPPPPAVIAPPVAPPTQKTTRKKDQEKSATKEPSSATVAETTPPSTSGTASDRGDMPIARGITLTPGMDSVLRLPKPPEEESHGTTVRNGPGEEPDAVASKEYEGEQLTRRLNGDLQTVAGQMAVAVGNVPGHFVDAQRALREALKATSVDTTPKRKGEVAQEVARLLFLSPTVSPEAARAVTDSPMGRSIAGGVGAGPNIEDQRFREGAMQMMGAVEAAKEKLRAVQLRTVLEMTTTPTGAIADVTVVEKSGDPRFDESVLHLSRKVFRSMPDNDDKRLGTSWWRSRWQFTLEPPDVRVKLIDVHRVAEPQ
jgi:outer membrane biosynthesis protein TonB